MRKKTASLIVCSALMLNYLASCTVAIPEANPDGAAETSEFVARADIEPIRAQDDFYGYVNLETLKTLELDYENPSAGGMAMIDTDSQLLESVSKIVNSGEEYPEGSCEQILVRAYNQFIEYQNNDDLKALANQDADAELSKIVNVKNMEELFSVLTELRRDYNIISVIYWGVDADCFDPDKYAILFPQITDMAGINIETINKNARDAETFESSIELALRVSGMDQKESEEVTGDLLYKIIDIAWATNEDYINANNPYTGFKFYTTDEINSKLTNHKIDELLKFSGIDSNPYGGVTVQDIDQLIALDKFICEENLELIKALTIAEFVNSYMEELSLSHDELDIYVAESTDELNLQAVHYLMMGYSSELSELYCKDYYTDEMDEALNQMCDDIVYGYHNAINNATWLSEEARNLLIQKLENIQFVTGGYVLSHLGDYSYENELFGENLYETSKNKNAYHFNDAINNLGKDHNRLELKMPMYVVNACYTQDNIVNITVAIMNAPAFDVNADRFSNLGGLGAVVGHEIGHGFDSNCLDFDYNGVFNPLWLPSEDIEVLNTRNQSAIEYFETSFSVFDVYYVDGEHTLGENYADLGSLEVITSLCETEDDYRTLFESYARLWCGLMTESDVIRQIAFDEHSPATIRVNAIVATLDVFYEVYDVQEGDGMYIAPENRIGRWN